MKLLTLHCALALGALTFAAAKASAFPLFLTSASGTITATAHYGMTSDTTSNKVEIGSVNLKKILTVVSNEVFIQTSGTNTPTADAKIAYDPYLFVTYLTNR